MATLAEEGVGAPEALSGTGLTPDMLYSTSTRVSYAQLLTVIKNGLRLSQDPDLAFRAGTRMHVAAYGMYGYGILSSPTLLEQIQFTLKYNQVTGSVIRLLNFAREEQLAWLTMGVALSTDPTDPVYRFALEFFSASQTRICRDLYGDEFSFQAVSFVYAAPPNAERYAGYLGCPVLFGQPVNRWDINPYWLDKPSRTPDAVSHLMAEEFCQQFLTDMSHVGGVASQVRRALLEKTPRQFLTTEAMAIELGMQVRTLRRRLEAEGTTYRELLAGVRKLLAIEYLRKTRMSTVEVASRLGYSDVSNFRNAFSRWTGHTPQYYRKGGR
ncbi:AraC family transcriptional regulator [Ottowia flava]|uniref:AraC family transcriptional regulator n=1 Tax=Ottowia flava TaxID=2675430 RepID=A0ABW4KMW7_9BURK